jgi:hypothetical protein
MAEMLKTAMPGARGQPRVQTDRTFQNELRQYQGTIDRDTVRIKEILGELKKDPTFIPHEEIWPPVPQPQQVAADAMQVLNEVEQYRKGHADDPPACLVGFWANRALERAGHDPELAGLQPWEQDPHS